MHKLTMATLALILMAGTALAQATKRSANTSPKLKTIRLHIDGFQKSKSGAI